MPEWAIIFLVSVIFITLFLCLDFLPISQPYHLIIYLFSALTLLSCCLLGCLLGNFSATPGSLLWLSPSLAFIWIKCYDLCVSIAVWDSFLLRYQAGSQRKEKAYSNEDDSRRCRGTIRDGAETQVSNSGAGTNSRSKETRRESGYQSLVRENHMEKIYLVRHGDFCLTVTEATLQREKQENIYPGLILLPSTGPHAKIPHWPNGPETRGQGSEF